MREKKLENIRRFGNYGYIFSTIALVFVIALFVIVMIFSISYGKEFKSIEKLSIKNGVRTDIKLKDGVSKDDFKKSPINIIFDGIDIDLDEAEYKTSEGGTVAVIKGQKNKEFDFSHITNYLIYIAISFFVAIINILLFRSIFKTLRDDASPFNLNIVKKLKIFAISIVPWMFLGNIFEYLRTKSMFYFDYTLSIDLNSLFYISIVYVLAKIFEYGVDLQVEIDDTV